MRCHLGGGDNVWRAFRWQPCGTSSFSVLKSPPVLQVLFSTHSWWLLKNKSKNLSFIFYLSYHWLKEIMRVVLFLLYLRFTNILKPIISPHSMFASMQHYWGVELQKWSILASLVCCSLLLPRQIEQINRIRDREETNLGFICLKFFFLGYPCFAVGFQWETAKKTFQVFLTFVHLTLTIGGASLHNVDVLCAPQGSLVEHLLA